MWSKIFIAHMTFSLIVVFCSMILAGSTVSSLKYWPLLVLYFHITWVKIFEMSGCNQVKY